MAVVPMIPPMMYRGDHYRLNFTTGLVLAILADHPDGLDQDEIAGIISRENDTSGIPGGSAASQWTPPPKKMSKTFDQSTSNGGHKAKADHVEDALSEDDPGERLPDTLKPTCTYFLYRTDHVIALLALMRYVGLVTVEDRTVHLSDLGRGVYDMSLSLEDMEQDVASARGALTATQEYLAGHSEDTTGGDHLVPYRFVPLSITEAANVIHTYLSAAGRRADQKKIGPQMLAGAATSGVQNPGVVRDVDTAELRLDSSLPIRRNLQRIPSYRQFLWIIQNDPDTFLVASASDGDNHETIVDLVRAGHKNKDLEAMGTKDALAVREGKTLVRTTRATAQLILGGGPEGVWVGKPLQPRDVHSDVVSFEAAGRAGFTHNTVGASSILWETYERCGLTMHDFQIARERLTGVGDVGAYSASVTGESAAIDSFVDTIENVEGDSENVHTLSQAGRMVERTSDELLESIGVTVVSKRPTKSGVPINETCTYVYKGRNFKTGGGEQRCRKPAIGGSGFCEIHGGTYLNPQETESLVRAAQQKIFATSSKAVEVIADLMVNSTNDAVRLRAAEQILNRAGLSESRDINISVDVDGEKESPAEVVRNKLKALSGVSPSDQQQIEAAQRRGEMSPYGEDERQVIEAEVVDP